MDLVEEEHRRRAVHPQAALGLVGCGSDVAHRGRHRRQRDEEVVPFTRHEPGEGGLSRAGGPPQDDRGHPLRAHQAGEGAARSDEVLLADDLAEANRSHPLREGRAERDALGGGSSEEVRHRCCTLIAPHPPFCE